MICVFIHLDVICTLYHIFVCYHVVSLLFLSKQLICSSFYFQDSFSPLLIAISTLHMEGRWNKLELWDWSDWMMWPTGSKCISWVGPLNKVIPRLIQFHMRRFSQSSTPHIPLHIKSNPWFHMTLQLSLCEIFFFPPSTTERHFVSRPREM